MAVRGGGDMWFVGWCRWSMGGAYSSTAHEGSQGVVDRAMAAEQRQVFEVVRYCVQRTGGGGGGWRWRMNIRMGRAERCHLRLPCVW